MLLSRSYNSCLEYLVSIFSLSKMTAGIIKYLLAEQLLWFKELPRCICSRQSHSAEACWVTMCIMLFIFGAKVNPYSLILKFYHVKRGILYSFVLLFDAIVSNFWYFDNWKLGQITQVHCFDSRDFYMNYVCFAVYKHWYVKTVFTTKNVVIDKNLMKILRNDKTTSLMQFHDCWIQIFQYDVHKYTVIPMYRSEKACCVLT